MTQPRSLRLNPADNVVIAIDEIPAGASSQGIAARERVPKGHKMATGRIEADEPIRKFGQIIGFARAIAPGAWVHEHNCVDEAISTATTASARTPIPNPCPGRPPGDLPGLSAAPSGKAGTRNYLGILTSVNCSATVARLIAREVERSGMLADYPNVDGVIALVHGTGCGMATKGEGFETLTRTQWGYAANPNMGGVLMVGLGCEVFQIGRMKEEIRPRRSDLFQAMTIQATGGTRKTIEAGPGAHPGDAADLQRARGARRGPASELMLALQCGGSDGYSGITANPALGDAVDMLVRNGGTAILSETPEIYGAEHLLTRRAASPEIGEKLVDRMHWWEDYSARNRGEMNNNPSPGNKAGGLTTILEKSLGAAAKGGTTALNAVYNMLNTSPPRASSSWTRQASIRSRRPARSRAGRTFSASPPAADRPTAANPRRRSSLRPTATCTGP